VFFLKLNITSPHKPPKPPRNLRLAVVFRLNVEMLLVVLVEARRSEKHIDYVLLQRLAPLKPRKVASPKKIPYKNSLSPIKNERVSKVPQSVKRKIPVDDVDSSSTLNICMSPPEFVREEIISTTLICEGDINDYDMSDDSDSLEEWLSLYEQVTESLIKLNKYFARSFSTELMEDFATFPEPRTDRKWRLVKTLPRNMTIIFRRRPSTSYEMSLPSYNSLIRTNAVLASSIDPKTTVGRSISILVEQGVINKEARGTHVVEFITGWINYEFLIQENRVERGSFLINVFNVPELDRFVCQVHMPIANLRSQMITYSPVFNMRITLPTIGEGEVLEELEALSDATDDDAFDDSESVIVEKLPLKIVEMSSESDI